MRDRLVHDYGQLDLVILEEVVATHLPALIREIEKIFGQSESVGGLRPLSGSQRRWIPADEISRRLPLSLADEGPRGDLSELAGETTDDLHDGP